MKKSTILCSVLIVLLLTGCQVAPKVVISTPLPEIQEAPIEQFYWIDAVYSGSEISVLVTPATLIEPTPGSVSGYARKDEVGKSLLCLSASASVFIPNADPAKENQALAPSDFPDAFQNLLASGAVPLFLVSMREDLVEKLEYFYLPSPGV